MAGQTTTTIDFGTTPVCLKTFVITDINITATSAVEAFVMVDSTSDNTTDDHRHAAVAWRMSILPATGSFTLYVDNLFDYCAGTFNVRYAWV